MEQFTCRSVFHTVAAVQASCREHVRSKPIRPSSTMLPPLGV